MTSLTPGQGREGEQVRQIMDREGGAERWWRGQGNIRSGQRQSRRGGERLAINELTESCI
jgi:hypothetical protein